MNFQEAILASQMEDSLKPKRIRHKSYPPGVWLQSLSHGFAYWWEDHGPNFQFFRRDLLTSNAWDIERVPRTFTIFVPKGEIPNGFASVEICENEMPFNDQTPEHEYDRIVVKEVVDGY